MSMTIDERKEAVTAVYDLTWAFRAHMDGVSKWRTPPVVDALQFTHSETGEVSGAEINARNYARNNKPNHDLIGELADTAFMLVTALPVGQVAMDDIVQKPSRLPATAERTRLSNIAKMVADAWNEWESGNHSYAENQAAVALHMVIDKIGSGAEVEVARRFLAIYAKHAPKANEEPQVVTYMRSLVDGMGADAERQGGEDE